MFQAWLQGKRQLPYTELSEMNGLIIAMYSYFNQGLIKKLYREFMIMGFISFAILLGTESSSGFSTTNQW